MATANYLRRKDVTRPGGDLSSAELRSAIEAKLLYNLGKTKELATAPDWYHATALAIRDRVVDIWTQANDGHRKRVYYLSIEFLLGRLLFDTLSNLQLVETARAALDQLGVDLDNLREIEPDAALGSGGLGRLAACFMDSMSALGIAGYGYGIRYENGLFEQRIHDGWQQEYPDNWLADGNPWEFTGREQSYFVGFGGAVEYFGGSEG